MNAPFFTPTNNPNHAGALAAYKELFGDCNRFAIAPVHTRFDAVCWFVWDAHRPDKHGHATIIRQADTRDEALRNLPA